MVLNRIFFQNETRGKFYNCKKRNSFSRGFENRASKMKFFWCQEFFLIFDLKIGCKNEFQDFNEKLCS